jgi:hypothetical protein
VLADSTRNISLPEADGIPTTETFASPRLRRLKGIGLICPWETTEHTGHVLGANILMPAVVLRLPCSSQHVQEHVPNGHRVNPFLLILAGKTVAIRKQGRTSGRQQSGGVGLGRRRDWREMHEFG